VKSRWGGTVAAGCAAWLLLGPTLVGCRRGTSRDSWAVKNLVLVSLDTLRGDRLGAERNGEPITPRLDAFAARAVRFTNCRSASGHTLASHKALLSGRLPLVWLEMFSKALPARPALVDANGYYRAALKEWPEPSVAERLKDAGYATAGFADGGYVSRRFGFAEGFDHYVSRRRGMARQCAVARRWLESREGRPFFLFVHTYDIHCPYDPPPRYLRLFGHRCHGRLEFEGTCGKPYFNGLDLTEDEREHIRIHYDAGVRSADDTLADFLDWLESAGHLRDTAVIITSDHGESLGERSFVGHGELYDNQLLVPLVVYVPGLAPTVIDAAVSGVDVGATILDLLTGQVPDSLDGRSLLGLMADEGRDTADRAWVASVTVNEGRRATTRLRKTATMEAGGLKLIADPDGGTIELFDLARDPGETRDLVGTGDPREGRARELARRATPGPLRGVGEQEEDLEQEGLPLETVEALRALGYVED